MRQHKEGLRVCMFRPSSNPILKAYLLGWFVYLQLSLFAPSTLDLGPPVTVMGYEVGDNSGIFYFFFVYTTWHAES